MESPRIEFASKRDLGELYELEKKCFASEAFSKNQICDLLDDYNSVCLKAREDGKIVGFIIGNLHPNRRFTAMHILTIDVLPERRRMGVGHSLILEIERVFKSRGAKISNLEVREDNEAAIMLYRKLGYTEIGRLRNYYGMVNGLYFEKALEPKQS